MLIGYARVSTADQAPELQLDGLRAAGCERIYTDRASGAKTKRPELDRVMEGLRPGDTLVVWALDRLGRNLHHLIALAAELERREVELRSLREGLDTSTAAGRLAYQIFGAMAEFERSRNSERSKAAAAAAIARGRHWGKRSVFHNPDTVETARALLREGRLSKRAIARVVGVDVSTLYRWFRQGDPDAFRPPAKLSEAA